MTTLFFGPMRSCKSDAMIESLKREIYGKKKAVLLRPSIDTRDFIARDKKLPESIHIITVDDYNKDPSTLNEQLKEYGAIGLDEIHFLPKEWLKQFLICYSDKNIYCTALLFGKTQEMFESIQHTLFLYDKIIQKTAICELQGPTCQNEATITFLKKELDANDNFVKNNILSANDESDKKLVGDFEYMVCCKQCFIEYIYPRRIFKTKN